MRVLLFFFCLLFSASVFAEDPPRPVRKSGDLQSLTTKLESEKDKKEQLASAREDADKKLQETKKELVNVAKSVRANEVEIQALDQRIETLTAEEGELSVRLQNDYGSMADLVLALERIRRMPPELLVVRPGAPLETAQAALLLREILATVNHRAESFSADLGRLHDVRASLDKDKVQLLDQKKKLDSQYASLSDLSQKREELYKQLNRDYASSEEAVEKIARDAASMQDFLDRLAREKARQEAEAAARPASSSTAAAPVSAARRAALNILPGLRGKAQLPVPGTLLTGYGEKDRIGAPSQGLTIQSSSGALVVAPMEGTVRFAGEFKNHGRLVILEHAKGYHSLIGGMGTVSVRVGQDLEAGEPLGKLPMASSRDARPTLYYELRYNGRPVNPSKKFPDLQS